MRKVILLLISISVLTGCSTSHRAHRNYKYMPPREGKEVEDKYWPKLESYNFATKIDI
jgi:hypothetical protein